MKKELGISIVLIKANEKRGKLMSGFFLNAYMVVVFLIWMFISFEYYNSFTAKVGIVSDGCIMPLLISAFVSSIAVVVAVYAWFVGIPVTIIALIHVLKRM